ncbi:family gt8 [Stylonychia lemnae]|uniref:Family gt8 n=1 Tax=Stylonychia lemnae TaxID=5949 RepID=A0A078AWH1_STYLE|nr:family gt8 [Stylonychia lemnae]|eukprot:CDW86810.1 family gt8 [Stylonychia lemnae]
MHLGLIFYIDADCLIMQNPENIFLRDTKFAAAPDVFPPDKFNAGEPSMKIFTDLISKIQILSTYDGGDTGFLNAYFPNWFESDSESRLPYGYNAQRTLYWFTIKRTDGYWKEVENTKDGIIIIHYSSSPKPWSSQQKGDLELEWFKYYMESMSSLK